jgi:hypothetical protein
MEVHHHAHSSRKKWTHYIWEFVMLFLAVFCGFLAENEREHFIEHKREKQFMRSLIQDLQLDTAWINDIIASTNTRMKNYDAAIHYLSTMEDAQIPPDIYQKLDGSLTQLMFFPNNGTVKQLNAGSMRLVRKRLVVDSIEWYERTIRRLEVRRELANQQIEGFREILQLSLNGKDLMPAFYDSLFHEKPGDRTRMIRVDPQELNFLIGKCISLRSRCMSDTQAFSVTRRSAVNLINFISKEYSISAPRRPVRRLTDQ